MAHLHIPADLLYRDPDYGPGANGYEYPNTTGFYLRFDPGSDGAITGSFIPPDSWDGTMQVRAVFAPVMDTNYTQAEYFAQARVCAVGTEPMRPLDTDTRHTVTLHIPAGAGETVAVWGPVPPFTPDGPAFVPGSLVTFRIGFNATSPNTNAVGAMPLRTVIIDL